MVAGELSRTLFVAAHKNNSRLAALFDCAGAFVVASFVLVDGV